MERRTHNSTSTNQVEDEVEGEASMDWAVPVAVTVACNSPGYGKLQGQGRGRFYTRLRLNISLRLRQNSNCSPWFMNQRAAPGQAYVPTDIEHIANVVTHGLWIAPSLAGLVWMLCLATTPLQVRTSLVYGCALLALFTVSTTFHSICYSGKCGNVREFFHIGDRAIIYLFIAASYTPWLTLKDFHGWQEFMLWTVWIAAVLGILYQYTFHERYKWLETFFYLVIGVCPAIVVLAMKDHTGLYEMAVGGLAYIIGVPFFKCDGVIPCAHAIWHCFVFIGATFHYCAVCKYLLGASAVFTA